MSDLPTRRAFLQSAAAAATALVLPAFASTAIQAQEALGDVLKVVPQGDLRILDPVWTTLQITVNHGYMVYDTLFSVDADLNPQPQMVSDYEVSSDGKTYRFTLREGLMWHDGSPVSARDCVASLIRWAARSAEGRLMNARGAAFTALDDRSFELTLDETFGLVEMALANPVSPCFMMREQEASTDPFEQVTTVVGSGPFKFAESEWQPGNRIVYTRNEDYRPRAEPPSGLAGGKIAKVNRVEWLVIPDEATAANALVVGEVDMLELPATDLIPMLQSSPSVTVEVIDPIGYQSMLRMNHLHAPFNNASARQAILHLVQSRQSEYLAAMIGLPEFQRECFSPFICGSPNESSVGVEQFTTEPAEERVRALWEKSGYDGRPIVILDPTDSHANHLLVQVFAQHMREIGANVDLQAMDLGTYGSRRSVKADPNEDPNGWHVFPTWWPGLSMQNPITNIPLETSSGGDNWLGWPADEELERLRISYIDQRTPEERQQVMDAIQARFFEFVPYVTVGQFFRPVAYRNDRIQGVIGQQSPVFWNIQRTA